MADITILELLQDIGVNAPFALVIWFLWKHCQRLEKQLEEAHQNERETLKQQLEITQRAALKAGIDVE